MAGSITRHERYEVLIEPRLEEIFELASQGANKTQMCRHLGLLVDDFTQFCKEYDALDAVVQEGRAVADGFVENAVFKRATGYTAPAEESVTENPDGSVTIKKTTKHLAPDVAAATFWLKNRKPDEWSDKQELELKTPKSLAALVKMTVTAEPTQKELE